MRTANMVAHNPAHLMPHLYDSGTGDLGGGLDAAIGTKAPGSAGGPPLSGEAAKAFAHGEIKENCIATVLVDTACSLKVYYWSPAFKRWVWGGAEETDATKSLDADGQWSFYGQEGTLFYLVSDVSIPNAAIHGQINNRQQRNGDE